MTARCVSAVLALSIVLVGCNQHSATTSNDSVIYSAASDPGSACASRQTFEAISALISGQILPPWAKNPDDPRGREFVAATSPEAIIRIVMFADPTVESIDENTGKVSCSATLTLKLPFLMIPEPQSLKIVGHDLNQTSIRATYGRQPTADTGKPIYFLNDLGEIANLVTLAAALPLGRHSEAQSAEGQASDEAVKNLATENLSAEAGSDVPLPADRTEELEQNSS